MQSSGTFFAHKEAPSMECATERCYPNERDLRIILSEETERWKRNKSYLN